MTAAPGLQGGPSHTWRRAGQRLAVALQRSAGVVLRNVCGPGDRSPGPRCMGGSMDWM